MRVHVSGYSVTLARNTTPTLARSSAAPRAASRACAHIDALDPTTLTSALKRGSASRVTGVSTKGIIEASPGQWWEKRTEKNEVFGGFGRMSVF